MHVSCLSLKARAVNIIWLLQSDRHRSAAGDTEPSRLHTETDSEPDQEDKYVKRKGSVKRSLQRVMPTMFQPTLPVTTRYYAPVRFQHRYIASSSLSKA